MAAVVVPLATVGAGASLAVAFATSGAESAGPSLGLGGQPLGQPGVAAISRSERRGLARSTHSRSAVPTGRPTPVSARTAALRTSCRSVAHIGDSTSVGLVSAVDLPDPAQRLAAQYARVGVRSALIDASGGRSIVETLPGQVNGYNVALAWASQGFHGCWVIALGTNDTANVSIGSSVSRMARIQQMMSAAAGQPVLWVNAWTLVSSGPWSQADMRTWDATLLQACASYPNMRVFDWAAVAQPSWFLPDGVHNTAVGDAARARAIADALARAFPSTGHGSGCAVS